MKILTFVVPSYHCASFLPKCITSLAHPQLLDQLEILIVNDGSTDDTLKVAEELEKQYPNAVRVISQENRGHGGALNTGCAAASGKYLKVIDADDWIETDNLPEFLKALENCEADVVLTHHYTRDISTGEIKKWKSYPEKFGVSYTMEQIMEVPRNFDRSLTFHGITYRTDFYRRNGMQLSEKVFYEDHEYATVPCCYAASVVPLDLFLYDYRIGDTQQSVSDANQLKRLSHMEAVLQRLLKEYQKLRLPEDSAGRQFYEMKAQGVLLAYITTVMLVEPDRKKGRSLGKEMMNRFQRELPGTYQRSKRQYQIFAMMNRLHLSKGFWEGLLHSGVYRKLRGSHDFN
jgi:glycosyltransferase involved in cell wall biosynthesis